MFERIAIIGAGPMGASLAGLVSGHVPTVLVVRDDRRASRIRSNGIRVGGGLEGFGRPQVVAHIDDLARISPIDLVFVATKTTAIPQVCQALKPHLAELPFVVSYQNGIEPGRTIIDELGTPRVVRMVLTYGATLVDSAETDGPLEVSVLLHAPPHFVGGEGAEPQRVAREMAVRLTEIGLPTEYTDDIDREAWRKGIANAAGNPVAAILRAPLGDLLVSPAKHLIERLLDEGIAVGRAAGIRLDDSYREQAMAPMARGGSHLPSMAEDVIVGRATEIEQLNVEIARRGAELGVPTPTHEAVIDLIRSFEWRSRHSVRSPGVSARR